MRRTDFDEQWRDLSAEVLSGMKEWRLQHPRASLKQIEQAVDERLARLRARMVEDAALASDQSDWTEAASAERPRCPHCERPLRSSGSQARLLDTHGGQTLELRRKYGVCPECGAGFFPPG